MTDYKYVSYEELDDGRIARILLDRPEARNAQNRGMLVELHDAFLRAERDDEVRVVIFGGAGPMFTSGHDMGSEIAIEERQNHTSFQENGGTRKGAEMLMLQEWHHFFENTRRWRNLRKITVAQVHGPVYAAGLMLMWACDLIVAAEDTVFADVVGTRLGMCGVEYFAHPWEFGPRKAKELLLTGLASCTAMDVISILRKMRVEPEAFSVEVSAEESGEHPKVFTAFRLRYRVSGEVPAEKLEKAIDLSQERYCGVTAMYRHFAPITHEVVME